MYFTFQQSVIQIQSDCERDTVFNCSKVDSGQLEKRREELWSNAEPEWRTVVRNHSAFHHLTCVKHL